MLSVVCCFISLNLPRLVAAVPPVNLAMATYNKIAITICNRSSIEHYASANVNILTTCKHNPVFKNSSKD